MAEQNTPGHGPLNVGSIGMMGCTPGRASAPGSSRRPEIPPSVIPAEAGTQVNSLKTNKLNAVL